MQQTIYERMLKNAQRLFVLIWKRHGMHKSSDSSCFFLSKAKPVFISFYAWLCTWFFEKTNILKLFNSRVNLNTSLMRWKESCVIYVCLTHFSLELNCRRQFFFYARLWKKWLYGIQKMCSCMLIMVHESADIGWSAIAKKNANSQMQHCIIT